MYYGVNCPLITWASSFFFLFLFFFLLVKILPVIITFKKPPTPLKALFNNVSTFKYLSC